MIVRPAVQTKPTAQLEAGELVAVSFHERPVFALAAVGNTANLKRALIFLEWIIDDTKPPVVVRWDNGFPEALSYGTDYEVVLNPSSEAVDVGRRRFTRVKGLVEVTNEKTLLLTEFHPRDHGLRHTLRYDLALGQFCHEQHEPEATYFARWQIRLRGYPNGHPLSRPLIEFAVENPILRSA